VKNSHDWIMIETDLGSVLIDRHAVAGVVRTNQVGMIGLVFTGQVMVLKADYEQTVRTIAPDLPDEPPHNPAARTTGGRLVLPADNGGGA